MTRVLVVQLTRAGDILQTTPMLRGIRQQMPGARVTLLVHERFAHVPVPGDLYDRLVPFPQDRWLRALSASPDGWTKVASELDAFVREIGDTWDLVLNLTHNALSGYLVALLRARRIEGRTAAPDRTHVVHGPWLRYLWASVSARTQACINLVDVYARAAGVPTGKGRPEIACTEDDQRVADEWIASQGLTGRPMIACQLGASEERKRWPPERFAATIDALSPDVGEIVLVGTSSEGPLADRVRAVARRPVYDSLGATNFGQLAALLRRCRVLLTNDTGPMHVAAAVGTRVVNVNTGPVFVHETGAYGPGHLVIQPCIPCFPCVPEAECTHLACRADLDPGDVAGLIRHAIGAGPLPRPARARILESRLHPAGRIEYVPISPHGPGRDDLVRSALAEMWDETLGTPGRAPAARPNGPLPPGAADRDPMIAALVDVAERATALANLAGRVRHGRREAVRPEVIEQAIRRLMIAGAAHPVTVPITGYLKVTLDSATARDPIVLARTYEHESRWTARRAMSLAARLSAASGADPVVFALHHAGA